MLLIVTVGLVVAGIVLVAVGFVDNSLGSIYAAILCAAIAGVALIVFSRVSRRRAVRIAGPPGGPPVTEPAFAGAPGERSGAGETVHAGETVRGVGRSPTGSVPAGAGWSPERPASPPRPEEAARPEPAGPTGPEAAGAVPPEPAGKAGSDPADELDGWDDDWDDDEPLFPIEDYDDLLVAEITPLLPELEADELLEVREREESTKARDTLLRAIDAALAELGVAPPPTPSSPPATLTSAPPETLRPAPTAKPAQPAPPAPAPAVPPSPVPPAPARVADTTEPGAPAEPIPGYGSMRAAQILPLLGGLRPADLAEVAAIERAGAHRTTVLTRIARLQGSRPVGGTPPGADAGPFRHRAGASALAASATSTGSLQAPDAADPLSAPPGKAVAEAVTAAPLAPARPPPGEGAPVAGAQDARAGEMLGSRRAMAARAPVRKGAAPGQRAPSLPPAPVGEGSGGAVADPAAPDSPQ